jgi:hypothetical protein
MFIYLWSGVAMKLVGQSMEICVLFIKVYIGKEYFLITV